MCTICYEDYAGGKSDLAWLQAHVSQQVHKKMDVGS